MATFLTPDKTITTKNGLTIKQKIIPDSLIATKDVASWIKKGDKMKPCKKLSDGTGKPKGITVHNTGDIKVASGTTPAEQYTRATFNGNMSGVVVHFYVWGTEIWQNLNENERGWHAADGSSRRVSQKGDGSKIGGNLDTIAIECIGNGKTSEDTTAKLVAYLCEKYGLNPETDVYTHKYFYPSKNCPIYILPHWDTFLKNVQEYYNAMKKTVTTQTTITTKPATTTTAPAATKTETYGKAGDEVKLSNTKVFASSTASKESSKKSGVFYLWSNEVVSGRIRITISKDKVGKSGQVTGWVNVSDLKALAAKPKKLAIGDVVNFKGTKHYLSSNTTVGLSCKAGQAKITNIKEGAKHPYHLVRISGKGATVYGWVNASDIG